MALRPIRIFYAWQDDLPNAVNRGFIAKEVERAAKAAVTEFVRVQLPGIPPPDPLITEVDRATKGERGAPDIAASIFSKIETSDIFIGDASIINPGSESPTSNPNVMV